MLSESLCLSFCGNNFVTTGVHYITSRHTGVIVIMINCYMCVCLLVIVLFVYFYLAFGMASNQHASMS